jgi:hypothetical protein
MKSPLLAGGLALAGFAVLLLADTKVDYSHHTDFSQYHTYSWGRVEAGDQLWADRIKRDIDTALTNKGWQMQPSGGQATVAAFGRTKNEQTLNTFYDGLGGGWGWRWGGMDTGMATTTTENTEVGTLNVDIFDTQSKKLIWRGQVTKTLSGNPEKNAKKLQNDINDLFKKFPPKSNGQAG